MAFSQQNRWNLKVKIKRTFLAFLLDVQRFIVRLCQFERHTSHGNQHTHKLLAVVKKYKKTLPVPLDFKETHVHDFQKNAQLINT